MKSRTSLLNKALLSHFSSAIFWVTLIFLILNIISLPLILWLYQQQSNILQLETINKDFFLQLSSVQQVIGMSFVAIIGIILFNYLNNEAASDFMHSLPIKRNKILSHILLVGFSAIVIPLLITAIILGLQSLLFIDNLSLSTIALWFVYSIFTHVVIFTISVLTGFFVNGSFLHIQLIIMVLFLPLVLWTLIYSTASLTFDGVSSRFSDYVEPILDITFPFVAIDQLVADFNLSLTIIWAIVALIFIILTFIVYKYRRNERVNLSFNFIWLKDILIAITTVAGMLALGTFVSFFIEHSLFISIIAYVVGALITFIIVEMLFQSSVKISFSLRTFSITIVTIIAFWILFIFSWNHYINSVPDKENIESVSITTDGNTMYQEPVDDFFEESYMFKSNRQAIENARNIHEIAVAEKDSPRLYNENSSPVTISYKLKDGHTKTLEFLTLDSDSKVMDLIDQQKNREYNMEEDMLLNMKNDRDLDTLAANETMIELDKNLVSDYKNKESDLQVLNPYIGNETGRISIEASDSSNYQTGQSSLYNPAILENVEDEEYKLTDLMNIDETSEMYLLEIDESEYKDFFKDFNSISLSKMTEEYDIQDVEDASQVIQDLNDKGLDPSSGKLLIYGYPEYSADDLDEETAANMIYKIISIK
jgi:ABC-2 type transport system permease protein